MTENEEFEFRHRLEQEHQSSAPLPDSSMGDVATEAAKSAVMGPYQATKAMVQNPQGISDAAPMAGTIIGGTVAPGIGAPIGAGLGQIASRMGDIAYGKVQPGDAMSPGKESIAPMIQAALGGFPETRQGKAIASKVGKGLAKIGSAFSGAKAADLERAAQKGYSTYGAPSMGEASKGFGNALEKSGINTTPTLESTIDPQLSQARQTALDAGKKLEHAQLPVVDAGAKTGDPHALFAYNDQFGPGGTERPVYNVFGDPNHPTIKAKGWGSSIPKDALGGIPIVGRQPNAPIMSAEEALKGRQAIDRIIAGTPQKDKPTLFQLGQLRDKFNSVLSNLSPETQTASKTYADAILKRNLTKVMPVNKSGEYSKLAPYLAAAAGSAVGYGHHSGGEGALAGGAYLLGTSPLSMGGIASTVGAVSNTPLRAALVAELIRRMTQKQGGQ